MKLFSDEAILQEGRRVLALEMKAIGDASLRLDSKFAAAVRLIVNCQGKIVVCGLGKSGHVSRKAAATFSSTGSPAVFLHPSEALHGDLGMVGPQDLFLAIAHGGETREVLEVARYVKNRRIPIIAITGKKDSSLALLADIVVDTFVEVEACPLNLAPTCSSTLALVMTDSLAVSTMMVRGISTDDFARLHPAGSLGKRLRRVSDIMIESSRLTFANLDDSFSTILEKLMHPNFGIIGVLDQNKTLLSCVSDGDIRRAISLHQGEVTKCKARDLVSRTKPRVITKDRLALDGLKIMEDSKITSLFVVDGELDSPGQSCLGLLRMFDILEKDPF